MTVRTRFAPSPTGYLHIGGARTALFSWLFARQKGGEFLLRIEDTDVERSTEESVTAIIDGMEWLALDWDEEPLYQSKRFDLYRKHAQGLLDRGLAYRCYCTPEALDERRKRAMIEGRPPRYDGRCRERGDSQTSSDTPSAVRFKVPPGTSAFNDMIKGPISIENLEIEDFIILRSDSTPTYHLVVVVDDASMEISHVIRGDDHINNTPKQMLLYDALGFDVPHFAHLPMILGADKARLSKRHGATSVVAYRDEGFLPDALVNYLARLGWSHGDDEIFSRQDLLEKFSFENVGKSPGVFNPDKLLWLNQHYIKESTPTDLTGPFLAQLKTLGVDTSPIEADKDRVTAAIATLQERAKTLKEMAEGALFYFSDTITYDEKAAAKFLKADKAEVLDAIASGLDSIETFDEQSIEGVFTAYIEESGLKLGKVAQPVRVALTGGTTSPGIFETIAALGKSRSIERIRAAAAYIKETGA